MRCIRRTRTSVAGCLCALMLVFFGVSGCDGSGKASTQTSSADAASSRPVTRKNDVIVLGTLGARHLVSIHFSIERIREIVRACDPDYVICEIPPDRLPAALAEYRLTGAVSDPRVRLRPEIVFGVFPLVDELGFELMPCSGWTPALEEERHMRLDGLRSARTADYERLTALSGQIESKLAAAGLVDDPVSIHSGAYDEIVRAGFASVQPQPDATLGAASWERSNEAHFALTSAALDRHRGEGRRFLVMFGAWNKYWIIDRLRSRDDVRLVDLTELL